MPIRAFDYDILCSISHRWSCVFFQSDDEMVTESKKCWVTSNRMLCCCRSFSAHWWSNYYYKKSLFSLSEDTRRHIRCLFCICCRFDCGYRHQQMHRQFVVWWIHLRWCGAVAVITTIVPIHERTLESIFIVWFAFGTALITFIGMTLSAVTQHCDHGILVDVDLRESQQWFDSQFSSWDDMRRHSYRQISATNRFHCLYQNTPTHCQAVLKFTRSTPFLTEKHFVVSMLLVWYVVYSVTNDYSAKQCHPCMILLTVTLLFRTLFIILFSSEFYR